MATRTATGRTWAASSGRWSGSRRVPAAATRVPRDNPFRNRSGARPENYAYGLRNPYRFSFDRRTGDLAIGDVGQDSVEEIDFVKNRRGRGRAPRGGYNFGWNAFEGNSRYSEGSAPGHVRPAIAHSQDAGFCSIIGGYVLRDRALGRGLYGKYVYGDYCRPNLRLATLRPRGYAHSAAERQGLEPRLVRRGRARARLRGLARRARVPAGPSLVA